MRKSAIYISSILLSGIYCSNTAADVVLDGSTGSTGPVKLENDTTYQITHTLGHKEGGNLYHSFQKFDVEAGNTAHFTGPDSVQNIISRVTGGDTSHIDGTIRSSIPDANFYLLNPSGVIFGANASIDIKGAFHVSTADYLRMGEDDYFYTSLSQESSFSTASPAVFGFTSSNVAPITIKGSTLDNNGKTISLIGGDVTISDSDDGSKLSEIVTDSGLIQIASVTSQGKVIPTDDNLLLRDFSVLGDIKIDGASRIDTSGASGGRVVIRGGVLSLEQSAIEANVTHSRGNKKGSINIEVSELELANHSHINTAAIGNGDAADIHVKSDSLSLLNGSTIASISYGAADAGNINLETKDINIDGPETSNDPLDSDLTGIYTIRVAPTSQGGNITINNKNALTIDNRAVIGTINYGAETRGDVNIESQSMDVLGGAQITTLAEETGNGGDINITADRLNISGVHNDVLTGDLTFYHSAVHTSGPTSIFATGDTGDINLNVENIDILDGARVQTLTSGSGKLGNIDIDSQKLRISGINTLVKNGHLEAGFTLEQSIEESSSYILSRTLAKNSTLTANEISIHTTELEMNSGGYISSLTNKAVRSSKINIHSEFTEITNGSFISTSSTKGTGDAGNIYIEAKDLYIDGNSNQFMHSGIYSNTDEQGGQGGTIDLNTESLTLINSATINSETSGDHDGGDIIINSINTVLLNNNAIISTKASDESSGNAGNIEINTNLLVLENSEINTSAISGRGGNIDIDTKFILITPDSDINAASKQSVNGNININFYVDLLPSLSVLPEYINDPHDDFRDTCVDKSTEFSSLITTGGINYFPNTALLTSKYGMNPNNFSSSGENQRKYRFSKIYLRFLAQQNYSKQITQQIVLPCSS